MLSKRIAKEKGSRKKPVKKKLTSSVKAKNAKTAGVKKTIKKFAVPAKTSETSSKKTKSVTAKTKTTKTAEKKIVKKTPQKKQKKIPVKRHKESKKSGRKKIKVEDIVEPSKVQAVGERPKEPKTLSPLASVFEPPKEKFAEQEKLIQKQEPEETKLEVKTGTPPAGYKFAGEILINELITIRELADKMKFEAGDVLKKLLSMGSLATINQRLDIDTAVLLASEFGYNARISSIYAEEKIVSEKEKTAKLKTRPPVVTIMGHVDHGKTSLLDAIRSSNVAAGEHGGITQHIGAYKVKASSGAHIAFLDTPGHEAFAAMRSRGAQATDIVVLVVSATDGVMPQTVEAINHAKAANVPIVVAVNKIDLPASDPKRIRQELNNYGLIPEEWGGDTIMVDISARQRLNIDSLLEMILLKAEMMELKANPDKKAEGIVIEAKLDSRRGPVATLLVQSGTLKIGDNLIVGTTYGKIKAMVDEYGERFYEAPPSTPAEVLGMNETPQAGDKFVVVERESQSREIARIRKEKVREASLKPRHHLLLADISLGQAKDLRVILKADVQGSLGAISDALERLSTSEINLKIIHKGAGAITESDVALAVASNALIVGFNLRPETAIERLAETEGVNINVYRIIYDLIEDVRAAMEGLLPPDTKEKILGRAVVKKVFKASNFGVISGCSVVEGKIQRGVKARLLRDNAIIFEGNISSLKRFKDDVKEVEKGYECGIGIEKFSDLKPDDVIENFSTEKVTRKLDGDKNV